MTDRDTFAAAALTGMIEPLKAYSEKHDYPFRRRVCQMAYIWADAMLRERGTAVSDNCVTGNQREMEYPVTEPMPIEKRAEVSGTLTDEEREAVEWAALALGNWADERIHAGDLSNRLHKTADTLRGLLDRLA